MITASMDRASVPHTEERGLKPATTSVPKRLTELVVAGFSPRLLVKILTAKRT